MLSMLRGARVGARVVGKTRINPQYRSFAKKADEELGDNQERYAKGEVKEGEYPKGSGNDLLVSLCLCLFVCLVYYLVLFYFYTTLCC